MIEQKKKGLAEGFNFLAHASFFFYRSLSLSLSQTSFLLIVLFSTLTPFDCSPFSQQEQKPQNRLLAEPKDYRDFPISPRIICFAVDHEKEKNTSHSSRF